MVNFCDATTVAMNIRPAQTALWGVQAAERAICQQSEMMDREWRDAHTRIRALKAEIARRSVEIEAASDALVAKMEAV